ncbi:MAG: F0F1 ATP synthase subunit A, partial [Solobacterium sp.]|nr:F0F1 ATP synthase subunit A [Solobacterium sp.]
RLFGNILCGGIMMSLVYAGAQAASNGIAQLLGQGSPVFNFLGPIVAPLLHAYFDVFAGFIQTLVFVTLTMVFVGVEIPDELKKAK